MKTTTTKKVTYIKMFTSDAERRGRQRTHSESCAVQCDARKFCQKQNSANSMILVDFVCAHITNHLPHI